MTRIDYDIKVAKEHRDAIEDVWKATIKIKASYNVKEELRAMLNKANEDCNKLWKIKEECEFAFREVDDKGNEVFTYGK